MLILFLSRANCISIQISEGKQKGQGLIEYALIILLIVSGVIVFLGLISGQTQSAYQTIVDAIVDSE
jgi:Flp pilus assembly pilin Flp